MVELKANTWQAMSDSALLASIGNFVRFNRLNQNKTQVDLSKDAGISRSTLSMLERGEVVTLATLVQVLRVLNLLHIMDVFKVQSQVSPIELAKLEQKKRKRAKRSKKNIDSESDW